MDGELLLALCVLWLSTTYALITFMSMWFFNEGESFHPHSIDVDHRHALFVVVHSETCCKTDCTVKNISCFVAPRGSSSNKQFTVLCVMISVAGFLGTFRWHKVGDGKALEVGLALLGFASLLLVAFFELDVRPERFFEDKLIVTGWLLQKQGLQKYLKFDTNNIYSEDFRDFILKSPGISHLYEELIVDEKKSNNFTEYKKYDGLWSFFHMIGAISFVILVTAAVLVNDIAEEKVAWITGAFFLTFSLMGYLTGNYFPVLKPLKGWILLWNPFLREPNFMLHLKKAVQEYRVREGDLVGFVSVSSDSFTDKSNFIPSTQVNGLKGSAHKKLRNRTKKGKSASATADVVVRTNPSTLIQTSSTTAEPSWTLLRPLSELSPSEFASAASEADKGLDNVFLRLAKRFPVTYLKVAGHLLVMSELVALLTPAVAMGIQWVTALCDGPPVLALIDLFYAGFQCWFLGQCIMGQDNMSHCILKS